MLIDPTESPRILYKNCLAVDRIDLVAEEGESWIHQEITDGQKHVVHGTKKIKGILFIVVGDNDTYWFRPNFTCFREDNNVHVQKHLFQRWDDKRKYYVAALISA